LRKDRGGTGPVKFIAGPDLPGPLRQEVEKGRGTAKGRMPREMSPALPPPPVRRV